MNPIANYRTGILTALALTVVTIAWAATENADAPAVFLRYNAGCVPFSGKARKCQEPHMAACNR
jgi:hypothetical protein